jgi:hypothetical protein
MQKSFSSSREGHLSLEEAYEFKSKVGLENI